VTKVLWRAKWWIPSQLKTSIHFWRYWSKSRERTWNWKGLCPFLAGVCTRKAAI